MQDLTAPGVHSVQVSVTGAVLEGSFPAPFTLDLAREEIRMEGGTTVRRDIAAGKLTKEFACQW